jgi:AcrR family transcriptional regulator
MSTSDQGAHGEPALRRDAQRNRELLIAAAREIYAEQGIDAPLDEIARRAGVGNATLYRRFPTREALIEAVFHDGLSEILRAGDEARATEDAWTGFARYEERVCEMLATDRGAKDLITTGLPGVPTLDALHRHNYETITVLIGRAQAQGTMRTDIVTEDVLYALAHFCASVPASAAAAPGAWRRHLALLLAAFRPEAAEPLPAPPLTLGQLQATLREMSGPGRRGTGAPAQG